MYIYTCILSDDSDLYGVLAVNENLKKVNSKYNLLCLIRKGVSDSVIDIIKSLEIDYKLIDKVEYNLSLFKFEINLDIIKVFSLVEYDKIVYLDLRVWICENIDNLFLLDEFSITNNFTDDVCIMVLKPNIDVYNMLIDEVKRVNLRQAYFSFDEVLRNCFSKINVLPICYNDTRTIEDEEIPCIDYLTGKKVFKNKINMLGQRSNKTKVVLYVGLVKPYDILGFDDIYCNMYYDNLSIVKDKVHKLSVNNDLISIIVPLYNQEKLISRSLDSIIKQTYKNIEVIVIDDCSTDDSYKIALTFSKKDKRVKVFKNEINSGASFCRNYGLDQAHGEYIGFVDADDYVEPDMYECMLEALKRNDSDFVQCGFFDSKGYRWGLAERFTHGVAELVFRTNEKIIFNFINRSLVFAPEVWCKLYTRKVISDTKFDVTFPKDEDLFFNFNIITRAKRASVIFKKLYHYTDDSGDRLSKKFSFNKEYNTIKILDFLECYILKKYSELVRIFNAYKIYFIVAYLLDSLANDSVITKDDDVYLKIKFFNEILIVLKKKDACVISSDGYYNLYLYTNFRRYLVEYVNMNIEFYKDDKENEFFVKFLEKYLEDIDTCLGDFKNFYFKREDDDELLENESLDQDIEEDIDDDKDEKDYLYHFIDVLNKNKIKNDFNSVIVVPCYDCSSIELLLNSIKKSNYNYLFVVDKEIKCSVSNNVSFLYCSMKKFKSMFLSYFEKKLKLKFSDFDIFDLKKYCCFFPEVLKKYVSKYSNVGYMDYRIVLGNIDKYLTNINDSYLIHDFDKIVLFDSLNSKDIIDSFMKLDFKKFNSIDKFNKLIAKYFVGITKKYDCFYDYDIKAKEYVKYLYGNLYVISDIYMREVLYVFYGDNSFNCKTDNLDNFYIIKGDIVLKK